MTEKSQNADSGKEKQEKERKDNKTTERSSDVVVSPDPVFQIGVGHRPMADKNLKMADSERAVRPEWPIKVGKLGPNGR